eukprot:2747822-Rhodomonas_salina.3
MECESRRQVKRPPKQDCKHFHVPWVGYYKIQCNAEGQRHARCAEKFINILTNMISPFSTLCPLPPSTRHANLQKVSNTLCGTTAVATSRLSTLLSSGRRFVFAILVYPWRVYHCTSCSWRAPLSTCSAVGMCSECTFSNSSVAMPCPRYSGSTPRLCRKYSGTSGSGTYLSAVIRTAAATGFGGVDDKSSHHTTASV